MSDDTDDDVKPTDTTDEDSEPDEHRRPTDSELDDSEPDDSEPDDSEPDDTEPDDTEPDDTEPPASTGGSLRYNAGRHSRVRRYGSHAAIGR